jgi:hypothetical protein
MNVMHTNPIATSLVNYKQQLNLYFIQMPDHHPLVILTHWAVFGPKLRKPLRVGSLSGVPPHNHKKPAPFWGAGQTSAARDGGAGEQAMRP